MSDTLVTAAVSAGAAFAASGLASWIALRSVRHQTTAQRELAAADRAERRAVEERSVRRDAYTQFITAAIRCAGLIGEAREENITDDEYRDRASIVRSALSDVIQAQAIVSVEGPAGVAQAAVHARRSLDNEFKAVHAWRSGTGSADEVITAGRVRLRAVGRMSDTARRAFGDESGPPPAPSCVAG